MSVIPQYQVRRAYATADGRFNGGGVVRCGVVAGQKKARDGSGVIGTQQSRRARERRAFFRDDLMPSRLAERWKILLKFRMHRLCKGVVRDFLVCPACRNDDPYQSVLAAKLATVKKPLRVPALKTAHAKWQFGVRSILQVHGINRLMRDFAHHSTNVRQFGKAAQQVRRTMR